MNSRRWIAVAIALAGVFATTTASAEDVKTFSGIASFYGRQDNPRVASGGRYYPYGMTCAHRTLPFGTRLRITDQKTHRSVNVTVNDRGPFVAGRVLDLSVGAAQALRMIERGVIEVHAVITYSPQPKAKPKPRDASRSLPRRDT